MPRILAALALTACTTDPLPRPVTETGNPERNLGVGALAPVPPTDDAPQIDAAWVGLGETRFTLGEAWVGEHELEWETPELVADLAAGPADLHFRSPNAGYDRVDVRPRTGRDRPPGAPDELEDASFVVDGTRGDGVPFRIVSESEEEIPLVHAFALGQDEVALALGFDLDRWLDGLDLDGATVGGDGTIRIAPGSNEAILSRFEANLPSSAELVEDADGDGEVDPEDPVLIPL